MSTCTCNADTFWGRVRLRWKYWNVRRHIVNTPTLTLEDKVAWLRLVRDEEAEMLSCR